MTPDGADPSLPQWLLNAATGVIAGLASAIAGIAWSGGSIRATLEAHDQRITTLENDIRYEIRALRETVEALHRDINALTRKVD